MMDNTFKLEALCDSVASINAIVNNNEMMGIYLNRPHIISMTHFKQPQQEAKHQAFLTCTHVDGQGEPYVIKKLGI